MMHSGIQKFEFYLYVLILASAIGEITYSVSPSP